MATYKQIIELQAQTAKALKQIDRFVSAAEKKVQRLEEKIGKQQNILGRGGGRSVRRVDGERLQGAKVALRLRKQEAEAVAAVLRSQQEVARKEENSLTRKLRLNAALRRQQTLELAIKRAGTTGERKERVDAALEEARAAKGSLKIQQATNALLIKELETQREINRTDRARDARRSRITTDIKNRIARLKAIGVSESNLNKIIGARDELVRLNESKQDDAANAQEARLNRLIKRQEELNKAYLQPQRQAASPIRGSATIEGSPRAREAADKERLRIARELNEEENRLNQFAAQGRRLKETAAKAEAKRVADKKRELTELDKQERQINKFAAQGRKLREAADKAAAKRKKEELDRLEKEENDINKALDKRRKLRENLARKAANEAKAVARQRQTKTRDILTGAGFPLLFGGGPGATLGGLAGGAVGGFGGSIALSALGAQFDKVGQAAKQLVDALDDPVRLLEELDNAGFKVSDSLSNQVKNLTDQGRVLDAANLALEEFANKVGDKAVKELQNFDAATDQLREELAKTSLIIFSEFAPAIAFISRALADFVASITGPTVQRLAANADPVAFEQARTFAREQSQNQFLGGDPKAFNRILTQESQKILDRAPSAALTPEQQNKLAQQQQRSLNIQQLELQVIKDKKDIAEISGKLTNDDVYYAKQKLIYNQTNLALQKAGNDTHAQNIALENKGLQLTELKNQREKEQLEIQEKITKAIERRAGILQRRALAENQAYDTAKNNLYVKEAELDAAKLGNDLSNQAVQIAQRELILRKADLEIAAAGDNIAARDLAITNRDLALQRLKLSVAEKIKSNSQQNISLQSNVLQEEVKNLRTRIAYTKLLEDDITFIEAFNSGIQDVFEKEKQILGLQRQSALANADSVNDITIINKLFDLRLQNLEDSLSLEIQTNTERGKGIVLARQLADIENRQKLEGISRSVGRDISGIKSFLQNPFGGFEADQQELQIEQLQRREDMERRISNALEIQQKIKTDGDKNARIAAEVKIKQLNDERNLYRQLYPELEQYEQMQLKAKRAIELMQPAIQGLSQGIGDMVSALIDGSENVQDALAQMLKNIGKSFVDMAAQIIVQQIAMITFQAILKALGGPSFGGGGDMGAQMSSTQYFNPQTGLGVAGPNFGLANGGPAEAGQPYMVGERGPELFVPSSNGGVMRNEDMRQLMGRSPASNVPAMNFTFETTNIGGQEFVSREQLEVAMQTTRRQAANDGAKRGMNMTLDRMQNSPRTRARVGIS